VTVRDRMAEIERKFTPSELKVIRELWANYPAAGLTTISRLARLANVSDPTVTRLANKLGFAGFVQLQEALLAEVEDHRSYPLMVLAGQNRKLGQADTFRDYLDTVTTSLGSIKDTILPSDFEAAATLLGDRTLRVRCLGGRFSGYLAAIMRVHLQLIRPDTEVLQGSDAELADCLIDVGPRDVFVIYDFRRYQTNVVQLASEAKVSGAKIILFTDKWRSPIARHANITFALAVETGSPFDSMTPGLLLTEALIATIATRSREAMSERMETMERFRAAHNITVDAAKPAGRGKTALSKTASNRAKVTRGRASDV
jgi:DNA-binding MurR/RpiR family transcriptional regulator